VAEPAWLTANDLLWGLVEQPHPDGGSFLEQIQDLARRRGLEELRFVDSAASEAEERRHRERLSAINQAEESLWSVVRQGIVDGLAEGRWLAFGYTSPHGELTPVHRRHWSFLELDFDTHRATGPGLHYSGLKFVELGRLDEVRSTLPARWRSLGLRNEAAASADEVESTAPATVSTAAAERACEQWITAQADSGASWTKRDALAAVLEVIGKPLSQRAFLRAWARCAPAAWKRPGRRRGA